MRVSLLAALVFSGAACTVAPVLVPDVGAERAPGTRSGAFTEVEGVRVTVDGTSWQGDPYDLGDTLTPILVTIENHSNVPIRVSYRDFALVGATGFRYAALPPLQVQGQMPVSEVPPPPELPLVPTAVLGAGSPVRAAPPGMPAPPMSAPVRAAPPAPALRGPTVAPSAAPVRVRPPPPTVVSPHFQHNRFFVSPSFAVIYPGLSAWPYYWPFDSGYYNQYYDYWPQTLPTTDMINQALPEGVLEAQGSIQGYVYFQKVAPRESRVKFAMQLVDPRGNRKIGEATVPLAVTE
jgi:hypothetical protein